MISTKKTPQENSITKRAVTASLVKPVIGAFAIFLIDRFFLNNTNTKSNILFAGSVGVGFFFLSSMGAIVKNKFPTSSPTGSLKKM